MTETGSKRSPSYPLLLLTVALGGVLAPLNSTMIAVALPEIRRDFSIGHAEIGWLVSSYLIAMAVAQPIGGRVGDQLGRARVFGAGLVAFLVLSVAATFSPWFPVLVVLRTGQALVGAAVIPNGLAMLRESVPVSRLGQSNGFIGSAFSFSAAAGPLLGAALLAIGSWRLLFLMNVPLVLLALGSLILLRYPDMATRGRFRLDWLGAVTFVALLAALTLVLNSARAGQNAVWLGGGSVALVLLLAAFVRRQRSSPLPIAEWRLFRNRSYAAATMHILLANLVMYTTLLSIPFFIEEVQGRGSGTSGLLLGAMSVLIAFVAPVSGHISDTRGRRLPAVAGSLIMSGAVVLIFVGMSENVAYGYLALSLALIGLGMGLSFGAAQTAAIESAPRSLAGAAAGTNSMMRYVGSIIGVGVLGAVLATNGDAPDVGLFRFIFAVLIGMSALATVAAFFIHRFPPEAEREAPAHSEPAPVSSDSGDSGDSGARSGDADA